MIKERIKKFLPDRLISKEKVNEIDIGVKQYYRTNMVVGWFIILGGILFGDTEVAYLD